MSTPEATGVRQRTERANPGKTEETPNPTSLSFGSNKNVIRDGKQPVVKPPFADVSMNRFLLYLVLGLLTVAGFYTWRFTVWAAEAGGYWALITGNHVAPKVTTPGGGVDAVAAAASAARAAGSVSSAVKGKASSGASAASAVKGKGKSAASAASGSVQSAANPAGTPQTDVQAQIYALASALGIKPIDLSNAIRPLIDPTVPNPAEAAQKELELLKLQIQAHGDAALAAGAGVPAEGATASQAAASAQVTEKHAGLLNVLGEVLLD